MEASKSAAPSWGELGYYTEDQLAALRGVDIRALRNERSLGSGPPFARVGRRILYPIKSTRAWIASKVINPSRRPSLADGRGSQRA